MPNVMQRENQQILMDRLAAVLMPLEKIAVALSGGVDSAVLLAAAARILGPAQVMAITVDSPMVPGTDHDDSKKAAHIAGVSQIVITLPESILEEPVFQENPPDRCYYCKKIIFNRIKNAAELAGYPLVADGTNTDDLQEYRPGLKAIQELGILSPLAQAGLSKNDVRSLAAVLCPEFACKPAMACLATRILHGVPITVPALKRIDQAEQQLREKGFPEVRVRDHNGLARIEIDQKRLEAGLDFGNIQVIRAIIHSAGFKFATLDLDGYRTGSLQISGKDDASHADPE